MASPSQKSDPMTTPTHRVSERATMEWRVIQRTPRGVKRETLEQFLNRVAEELGRMKHAPAATVYMEEIEAFIVFCDERV